MTNPNKGFLDFNAIFQKVYDEDKQRLRVDSSATVELPDDINISIDHTEDSVRLGDGVNFIDSTTYTGKRGLNVYVVGMQMEGFKEGIKTHKIPITSTPTAIITSPLSNRKVVSIRVMGGTVYFAENNVVATDGYPKYNREEIVLSISEAGTMTLYASCEAGFSSELRVLELA